MELKDALRKLLLSRGPQVLDDIRLANMLADFKAYEELPAVRYLIKTCLSEGLMRDIIDIYNSGEDSSGRLDDFERKIINDFGFRDEVAIYFIDSIKSAFGWSVSASIRTPSSKSKEVKKKSSSGLFNVKGNHLAFKGVPITGDPQVAIIALESKGFSTIQPYSTYDHGALLHGTFAGIQDCNIFIGGTAKTDTLYMIGVFLPPSNNWYNLKDQYYSYKEKLSNKYGEPKSFEYFDDPYYEGDGYEISALDNGKCHFTSIFKVERGSIIVSLSSQESVMIAYQDSEGNTINSEEMNDLADNDL